MIWWLTQPEQYWRLLAGGYLKENLKTNFFCEAQTTMKRISTSLVFLFLITTFVSCSSEDRDEFTKEQAKKITDSIQQPIDQAKEAARQLDKHNSQLPD